MPFQWDEANERLLLLTIIHVAAPATPKWDEVARLFGNGLTGNAIRQKYQKLRNEAKDQFGDVAGATPKKPTATKDGGTPASGKKRKTAKEPGKEAEAADAGEDGAAGDDEEESPTKKVKTEAQDEFV